MMRKVLSSCIIGLYGFFKVIMIGPEREKMEFQLLNDRDVAQAYSIICRRVEDLSAKGIRQYARPYPPRDLFQERQVKKYNHAVYMEDKLAAIVTLIPNHTPEVWTSEIRKDNFIWVTSLFSSEEYKGQNLGYYTLDEIDRFALSNHFSSQFLDCYLGNGFLLNYYLKKGFIEISRKNVKYPNHEFEAVLMEKEVR